MTNKEHYADYKWIKVKRYTDDPTKPWEDRYKSLDEHHLKETTFMIEEVRRLADKLDEYEKLKVENEKKALRADRFRSFLICWFGFSAIPTIILDFFVDKQTQLSYHPWILISVLLFGLGCSSLLTYFKWKKENE